MGYIFSTNIKENKYYYWQEFNKRVFNIICLLNRELLLKGRRSTVDLRIKICRFVKTKKHSFGMKSR
jgi:hypothetical protein